MNKFLLVAAITLVIVFFVLSISRKMIYGKLVGYLENGDFESFYKNVDKPINKLMISKVDLSYFKLKAAFIEQNKKKVIHYLDEIEPLLFSDKQKGKIYMDAFNYFIGIQDKHNAKEYLTRINEIGDPRQKIETNRVYNIYIKKSDEDLKDLLDECEDLMEENRAVNEYLISLIYKNKNDKENQKKYEELSKKHMAILDETIRQSKIKK